MSLIALRDAHLALGDRPLLDGARLTLQPGERLVTTGGFLLKSQLSKSAAGDDE